MPELFDMRLIQRGARLRRSPFFEATLRYGCRAYTVYNHMFLPSYYDDPVNEYWHLLNEVTLWDVSVERNTEITGPDAFRFTSLLTPRDLSKCARGAGQVCADHDRRRRHRQRSGAAAPGRTAFLAGGRR